MQARDSLVLTIKVVGCFDSLMLRNLFFFTFLAIAVVFGSSTQAQTVITNGSFELPGFSNIENVVLLGNGDTDISGWTVGLTYGRPIEWGKTPTYAAQQGDYSLRMGPNASIFTMLDTIVGETYRVSFWGAGGATQSYINASVGSTTETLALAANSPWQEFVLEFTGDPGLRLTAGGLTEETRTGLDNVTVSLVPEPSTYVLLAVSAVGFLLWTKRRRV